MHLQCRHCRASSFLCCPQLDGRAERLDTCLQPVCACWPVQAAAGGLLCGCTARRRGDSKWAAAVGCPIAKRSISVQSTPGLLPTAAVQLHSEGRPYDACRYASYVIGKSTWVSYLSQPKNLGADLADPLLERGKLSACIAGKSFIAVIAQCSDGSNCADCQHEA